MPHCQHWEMLWILEALRDLDDALPALPLLSFSPSPLHVAAGVPPPAASEGTLASQEEVGMMLEAGNRKRDCQPSFPQNASELQEDGMVAVASG